MAKIVYIGNFTRLYDEEGIAKSFEKLGHTVIRVAEQGYIKQTPQFILEEKPDFVLFAKLKIPMGFRVEFFKLMKDAKIMTVCWMPDLYIGLGRQRHINTEESIFQADFVFSPDGGHDKEWKGMGVNHHLLRQGIYDEECALVEPVETKNDIVFIGTRNGEFPYRQTLMMEVSRQYGGMFRWFGSETPYHIRGGNLSEVIRSTKIILGDSVYSPRYWSNRIYESIGRGGFIIHPNIEGLEEEFTYYKHFVPYDYGDFEGLFDKIDYYLTHDNEREYIAQQGREHVMEHHTLLHRCKSLLQSVS